MLKEIFTAAGEMTLFAAGACAAAAVVVGVALCVVGALILLLL